MWARRRRLFKRFGHHRKVAGYFEQNSVRNWRDAGNRIAEAFIDWLKFSPYVNDAEVGELAASLSQKVLGGFDGAAPNSALLAVRIDRQQAQIASARILDLHINAADELGAFFEQQEFPAFEERVHFFRVYAIAVNDGFSTTNAVLIRRTSASVSALFASRTRYSADDSGEEVALAIMIGAVSSKKSGKNCLPRKSRCRAKLFFDA